MILLAKSHYALVKEEKVEKRVWGGLISKNHSASRPKFNAIAVRYVEDGFSFDLHIWLGKDRTFGQL
jgi:hypothetical protein